jgi:hypothetical protein
MTSASCKNSLSTDGAKHIVSMKFWLLMKEDPVGTPVFNKLESPDSSTYAKYIQKE